MMALKPFLVTAQFILYEDEVHKYIMQLPEVCEYVCVEAAACTNCFDSQTSKSGCMCV